jgi:flavin reductase (DIM6/NTAB) family NADH-FMN oxidoreductase RutF
MEKLGPVNALYPTPTTLVGTVVDGRPNFLAIAHVGIMNHGTPQFISIGVNKAHYSHGGIVANRTFSVCIPSEEMMVETDYCGIASGKKTDKSTLFEVFYGALETAPMIVRCPVCMECRLDRTFDFDTHDVFVGEIVETYADGSVLTEGKIDIGKVRPLLFDMRSLKYWRLGEAIGRCWSEGRQFKR